MERPRRLYVLRHAKSSWDDPSRPDFERPLAGRGKTAVKVLARYLEEHQVEPDLVLCSPAARTVATLHGVFPSVDAHRLAHELRSDAAQPWEYPHGEVVLERALYAATADEIVGRLQALPDHFHSVMVIGHNPALQMLVVRLAGGEAQGRDDGAEGLAELRRKLPTGGLVTLEVPVAWGEVGDDSLELVDYVRPKVLRHD